MDDQRLARTYFRPDIQGLRAIAVGLVVLSHADIPGFTGGFIGVDMFFVISGFVITQTLVTHRSGSIGSQLKYFYQRRVLRIIPAATSVLIVTLLVSFFVLHHQMPAGQIQNTQWAALFAGNFYLVHISADYFIQGLNPAVLTHYWSLAVEEQFYLVFPLIFLTLGLTKSDRIRRTLWWVLLFAVVVVSFVYSYHQSFVNPVLAYYSPFTRAWELGFGALVAVAPRFMRPVMPVFSDILVMICAGVLIKAMFVINPASLYPGSLSWLVVAPTGGLLLAGAANQSILVRAIGLQPLRFIGDISYSLYLYHFVWLVLPEYFRHPLISRTDRVLEIGGALACAVISTYLLENPIRRSPRLKKDGWSTVLILLIGICAVFAATFAVRYFLIH